MDWLQILIQGGALGTVVALIWYMNQRDKRGAEKEKMHNTTISNHMTHSTEAQVELAKSLKGIDDTMRECLKDKLHQ